MLKAWRRPGGPLSPTGRQIVNGVSIVFLTSMLIATAWAFHRLNWILDEMNRGMAPGTAQIVERFESLEARMRSGESDGGSAEDQKLLRHALKLAIIELRNDDFGETASYVRQVTRTFLQASIWIFAFQLLMAIAAPLFDRRMEVRAAAKSAAAPEDPASPP